MQHGNNMKQSSVIAAVIGVFLSVGGVAVYTGFEKHPPVNVIDSNFEFENDYKKGVFSFNKGEYSNTLSFIQKHWEMIEKKEVGWEKWSSLFIETSFKTLNVKQLISLYHRDPNFFSNNENASLLIAKNFVLYGKNEDYLGLRKLWANREIQKFQWLIVDADYLILEGKRDQAIKLLNSHEFKGKEETDRLLYLYSMYVHDQPKTAIDYLNEAFYKDPTNSLLLCTRAKVSETSGNSSEAFSDYLLASLLFPNDLCVKEQLADYLIRTKKYIPALKFIEETASDMEISNQLLLKMLFWSKMVKPLNLNFNLFEIPDDADKGLIEYILQLKPQQFWNNFSFNKIKNSSDYANNSQEIFWLQLIEELRLGNDALAHQLLIQNSFKKESWDPKLERTLKKIVEFRRGELSESEQLAFESIDLNEISTSNFFEMIENSNIDDETEDSIPNYSLSDFLNGPFAYSTAFLAAGWNNVAIELMPLNQSFNEEPDWLLVSYARAIRESFGDSKALAFLKQKPKSPLVDLFIGEVYFEQDKPESAIVKLKKLTKREDEIGVRALWLLSLIYLKDNNREVVKEIIFDHPQLKNSVLGIDSLARLAIAEGQTSKAKQLFRSIENHSTEAQSFLSNIAFSEKKFEKAKELTLKLLEKHPDSITLQNNFLKIIKAQEQNNLH